MCRIHYEDLNVEWKETLKYCFRTSDRFSLITRILSKKKGNAVYAHDKALTALEPFLIERKVGVKSWPGTITKGTDYVMDLYDARKYRKNVTDLPNFFRAERKRAAGRYLFLSQRNGLACDRVT